MKHLLTAACLVLLAAPAFADQPREGEPAPAVELPAAGVGKSLPGKKDGDTLNLQDFKGKKNVVLFFYPKAMTSGCTVESCGFRDVNEKFAKLDTVIIGISTDPVGLQQQFVAKEKLNFPLLADADKAISKRFGVLNEQRGFANRVTFVIDKSGTVAKVYTKVTPKGHPEEVLKFIEEKLGK